MLRAKGIGYDTGFNVTGARSHPLDAAVIRRELEITRDDLHCTAVRLIGNDMDQMEVAAQLAAGLGLETWINPYPYEASLDEARALLADAAVRAERVRRDPATRAEVVLVAGAELSIFTSAFLPGATLKDRTAGLLRRDDRTRELMAHREGLRGSPRRHVPGHDVGAEGGVRRAGRVLPKLTGSPVAILSWGDDFAPRPHGPGPPAIRRVGRAGRRHRVVRAAV